METTGVTDGQRSNNKRQLFPNQQVSISTRLTRTYARSGDAELTPWLLVLDCTTDFFLCATQRQGVTLVDCLQPLSRLMAALSGGAATASAADTGGRVLAVAAAPTRAPLARCCWLRPRHLAREAPRLCLVETVLPSPEDVASAGSFRCSTSFQSMRRQPAVRCSGLSAFCAAVCTNESSSCQSTDVLESRFTRSKLDSTSKKNSAKCLATSLRIEFLYARMYAWSSG